MMFLSVQKQIKKYGLLEKDSFERYTELIKKE